MQRYKPLDHASIVSGLANGTEKDVGTYLLLKYCQALAKKIVELETTVSRLEYKVKYSSDEE